MRQRDSYSGPERRRFRRLELHYPVRIEMRTTSAGGQQAVVEGITENISFGGALVDVSDASALRGATPVTIRFTDRDVAVPATTSGVVWRRDGEARVDRVAVEFDAPLLTYEGAIEIADRLQWLRDIGGEELLRVNVERFLDAVPDSLRAARQASADGDLQALAQVMRALKSHAGNIGAVNLYELARRAEQAAGQGDAAACARFVDSLPGYFEAARVELETNR